VPIDVNNPHGDLHSQVGRRNQMTAHDREQTL
jgi:hypothetical protein